MMSKFEHPFTVSLCIYLCASQRLFAVLRYQPLLPDWLQANILCNESISDHPRGQLASSHNLEDDMNIATHCETTGSSSCWIGLYRKANHQDWHWIDNTPIDHGFIENNPNKPNVGNIPWTGGEFFSPWNYLHEDGCVGLIWRDQEYPTWCDDCGANLLGAVCQSCGDINEYCCGMWDECNSDNLHCINNRWLPKPKD